MNFDDYAKYIQQKYRLAIALAVIKTKPINTNIKDHINTINRVHESKMDEICEDDFNFDDEVGSDDSLTILKDLKGIDIPHVLNRGDNSLLVKSVTNIDEEKAETDSNITFFEESQEDNLAAMNVTYCETGINSYIIENNDSMINMSNNDSLLPNYDSQQTVLYTVPDTNTHISQSQDNIIIMEKYLYSKDNKDIINSNVKKMHFENQNQLKSANYLTYKTKDYFDNVDKCDNYQSDIGNETNQIYEKHYKSQDYQNINSETPKKIVVSKNGLLNEIEYCSSSKNFDKMENQMDSNSNSSLTETQAEIVSFKVLEELSRIKSYIYRIENKQESDSGYKSIQTKSCRSLQLSGCWNESAYCLLSFLTSCPLVVNIMDVCEEISKVLGRFIDILHCEEKYPKFMEDLLDTIERLINDIYNYKCDDGNMMLIDEKIHRIFLLNRTQHIISYSLEKITSILDDCLRQLKDIIEIENTERSENLCYILNIMEILLKRYLSYEKNSSQSQSQETVLKRSSLTDIWRKKWNLSKNEVFQMQSEKKCILTECSNILNKLIVESMDNYSLVSFAALQCFNIMQK